MRQDDKSLRETKNIKYYPTLFSSLVPGIRTVLVRGKRVYARLLTASCSSCVHLLQIRGYKYNSHAACILCLGENEGNTKAGGG